MTGRGKGGGTGSPVWFHCWASRQVGGSKQGHVVNLTGRERPYRKSRYSAKGSRSTSVSREYVCSCGHIGWSNHVDLERLAVESEAVAPVRVTAATATASPSTAQCAHPADCDEIGNVCTYDDCPFGKKQ